MQYVSRSMLDDKIINLLTDVTRRSKPPNATMIYVGNHAQHAVHIGHTNACEHYKGCKARTPITAVYVQCSKNEALSASTDPTLFVWQKVRSLSVQGIPSKQPSDLSASIFAHQSSMTISLVFDQQMRSTNCCHWWS